MELETEIRGLRHKIREVDIILGSLGSAERKLIELKYMHRFNKDFWIAGEIGMAVRSYYRMKKLIMEISIGDSIVNFIFHCLVFILFVAFQLIILSPMFTYGLRGTFGFPDF